MYWEVFTKPVDIGTHDISPSPPPQLECIRGPHACSHFLGKGGIFGASSQEDFPIKHGEVFFLNNSIANGNALLDI